MHLVLRAVLPDHSLCGTQIWPGETGEEVMLDLVLEPAQCKVDERAATDIAGHQNLPAQEVDLHIAWNRRHADVVGREGSTEEETEDAHLHADECGSDTRRQKNAR